MTLLLLALGCLAPEPGAPAVADRDAPWTGAYAPLPDEADLDAAFETLFAPWDPTVSLELALIDRVRAARLADDGVAADATWEDGTNPYAIRYAVYNLRNPEVIDALIAARDDGVDVQVLVEKDQLDPERTWNTFDETLEDAGFVLVEDNRASTAEARAHADLVGIGGGGLMHLKTRLFTTPAGTTLLTGSMNPGDNAIYNDETLHLVHDPALVAAYEAAWQAVLDDEEVVNTWDADAAANVLFSPEAGGPRAGARILDWLAEEDEQILLAVYSLRDFSAPDAPGSLVEVLAERAAAGVPVHVITDRKQSDDYWDDTEDALRAAGVHVWEVRNEATPYTAMHAKFAVLGRGGERVITDASNWTVSGLGSASSAASNTESTLFLDTVALDGGRTGRRYLGEWLRILGEYADAWGPVDGEPGFDEVFADLAGRAGWPEQPVAFVARDAETYWGETVRVLGDQPVLGDWGATGPGWPLTTDADTYPTWWTEAPATLPLGTRFQWKLTASFDDGVPRWEAGDNRVSVADPPPFVADGTRTLEASWR